LEPYGITEHAKQSFDQRGHRHGSGIGQTLGGIQRYSQAAFCRESFLELDEEQKKSYLDLIDDGSKIAADQAALPVDILSANGIYRS
jgi:hypothetical protein